jgi:cytochrome c oxidase subunit IV
MSQTVRLIAVYLGLLVLLALTVVSAFLEMGVLNPIANLSIAAAKATLVGVFFMHLFRHGTLPRLTVLALFVWLFILYALTMAGRMGS